MFGPAPLCPGVHGSALLPEARARVALEQKLFGSPPMGERKDVLSFLILNCMILYKMPDEEKKKRFELDKEETRRLRAQDE
jgi:hypothetical protein